MNLSSNGDEAGLFGPQPVSVTLDGSGNGSASLQAKGQKLQITGITVRCSTNTKEATGRLFKNTETNEVGNTATASTGDMDNTGVYFLNDGDSLIFKWYGGDAGATATITFTGWASVPGRGFRTVH